MATVAAASIATAAFSAPTSALPATRPATTRPATAAAEPAALAAAPLAPPFIASLIPAVAPATTALAVSATVTALTVPTRGLFTDMCRLAVGALGHDGRLALRFSPMLVHLDPVEASVCWLQQLRYVHGDRRVERRAPTSAETQGGLGTWRGPSMDHKTLMYERVVAAWVAGI